MQTADAVGQCGPVLDSPAMYSQQYSAMSVLVLQDPELESPLEYGCGVLCHFTAYSGVLVGGGRVQGGVFASTL
jgi:hypothetical protein